MKPKNGQLSYENRLHGPYSPNIHISKVQQKALTNSVFFSGSYLISLSYQTMLAKDLASCNSSTFLNNTRDAYSAIGPDICLESVISQIRLQHFSNRNKTSMLS